MRCACFPCHSCHRNVRAWRARVIHGGVAGNRFSSPMPLHGVASFMRASLACVPCLACGSFHVPCFRASCINCRGTESGMSGTNDLQPMHSMGMLPCCAACAAVFFNYAQKRRAERILRTSCKILSLWITSDGKSLIRTF